MLYHLIICSLVSVALSYDRYSSFSGTEATAMDIDFTTNRVVLAYTNYQLKNHNLNNKATLNTITTNHKAQIISVSVSDDASLVLTGTRDYTSELRYLNNGTLICTWDEIRGKTAATTILPDNSRIAFATEEGYLYYGHSTNCSITRVFFSGHRFTSMTSLSSGDQVWLTDFSDKLIMFDISTGTNTTYLMATSKLVSVVNMVNTAYLGVCSQKAFYIVDTSGTVQATQTYPAGMTKVCRIMPSSSSLLYLTATT